MSEYYGPDDKKFSTWSLIKDCGLAAATALGLALFFSAIIYALVFIMLFLFSFLVHDDCIKKKKELRSLYQHLSDEQFDYFYRRNRLTPPLEK